MVQVASKKMERELRPELEKHARTLEPPPLAVKLLGFSVDGGGGVCIYGFGRVLRQKFCMGGWLTNELLYGSF